MKKLLIFVLALLLQLPGIAQLKFRAQTGVSYLEHLNYGEFGTYRKYLPELKVGLTYTL